jgi:two-component system, OmpR family, sensor kinase
LKEWGVILQQRDFLSMASHELRTLLAQIDGHAQRMISMQERLTSAEIAERAHRIRGAVRGMTQLVNDLVGSAQLVDGRGDVHYRPTEVDLAVILSEVCELQRELTPHALIREVASPQPFIVQGDATLLRQVFGNILSNAVRYSPQAAQVDVSIARENDVIAILIQDRGVGVPEHERQRVFERCYRGSNTAGVPGSGVGLYVVKTLIDLHQGSVAAHGRDGGGSRFEVRLPSVGGVAAFS